MYAYIVKKCSLSTGIEKRNGEMRKRTICMMADGDVPFNGFCALASLLEKLECYRIIIICEKVNNIEQIISRYDFNLDNIEILIYERNTLTKYELKKRQDAIECQNRPKKRRYLSKIKEIYERNGKDIHYSISFLLWQTEKEVKRLKNEEKIARNIFKKYSPDILLIYTDRNIGLVQSMIYVAKMNQVPRVIAPITISRIDFLMKMRFGRKEYIVDEKTINSKRLIERINSDWILEYKGDKYIFYQPWVALAGFLLKRISLKPWIMGGGDATMVAVSSEEAYAELRTMCCDVNIQDKYVLTKHIEESMVEASYLRREDIRRKISEKYGLNGNRIIIFALPQLYEHKLASWEACEYNNIKILEKLASQDADVLVSLHPKMIKSKYTYVEKMGKAHLLDEALSSVIGIADMFVCFDGCSTKEWAESLGIDIINFETSVLCHKMDEEILEQSMRLSRQIENDRNDEIGDRQDFCAVLKNVLNNSI